VILHPGPSETWLLLKSPAGAADWNMALDEALLEAAPRLGSPVLRFYGWTEPAASFGYFQKYSDLEPMTGLRPLVRRPTAGGLVPHAADWTYSLIFPQCHWWYALKATESYLRLHEWIREAFALLGTKTELAPCCQKELPGQCFAGAERSDLLWNGRKIAGAAQRRTRAGLLVQGSIQPGSLTVARSDFERAFSELARMNLGADWQPFKAEATIAERARELAREKYSQPAYNQRR
jgi:lipoate-protein ligase A